MEFTKKDLNKTLWVKPADMDKQRVWWKVDATGKTLGRLATDIAKKLLGKHKSYYCDFWDCGDFVIVENIQLISVSGGKELKKCIIIIVDIKEILKQRVMRMFWRKIQKESSKRL
jgi:ribosomal protein L13